MATNSIRVMSQGAVETIEATVAPRPRNTPQQFADWRDLPSDIVEQKEVQQAVAKALGELPEIYREVFALRDMDVAETAEILGLGQSAVKTRLHRARLMLREALTPMFAKPKVSVWER